MRLDCNPHSELDSGIRLTCAYSFTCPTTGASTSATNTNSDSVTTTNNNTTLQEELSYFISSMEQLQEVNTSHNNNNNELDMNAPIKINQCRILHDQ